MGTVLTTWLLVRTLGQVASFSIIAISLLSFSAYMWQTRTQLRIIIRQEYSQEHRNDKSTSHADNQELAEVLTSIHSLYPIPGICHEYKSGQGFHGLRYGWLLYCLGFLCLHKLHHCCIPFFRQLDIAPYSRCIFVAVGYSKIRVCCHRVRQSAKQLLSAMVRVGR